MIHDTIDQLIKEHDVVLFMKGEIDQPMCGFSAQVVHLLKQHKVSFYGVNVLVDDAIRQGIKDYSQWPTIPQLYVKGEFIGGCDIITEMHESGELAPLLNVLNTTE